MPYGANCCPNCGVHDGYGTNYCRACGQPAEVSAIIENGRQAIQDVGALFFALAGSESDEDDD